MNVIEIEESGEATSKCDYYIECDLSCMGYV